MKIYKNLYCKIFIDTDKDKDKDSVMDFIMFILSGEKQRRLIISENMEVYIDDNDDFSKIKRNEDPDGFLFSRYYLDIKPNMNVKQDVYIACIAMLLERLWSNEYKAIAACDFEEELPRKGGYNYNTPD